MNVAVAHQSHATREKIASALRSRGLQVFSVPDAEGLLHASEQAKLVLVLVEPKILRREQRDLRAQLREQAGYHVQVVALANTVTDEFAEVFQRHGATLVEHPVESISPLADWVKEFAARLAAGRVDDSGGHWIATGKDGGGEGAKLMAEGSGPSILVVEDEPGFRHFVSDALATEGYEVWAAANGEDALRFFEKREVDLVLCDINMPGMDGFALKQKLDQWKKSAVPFIIMTADSNAQNAANAAAVGVVFILSKPIRNIDALFAIVKETLRKAGVVAS